MDRSMPDANTKPNPKFRPALWTQTGSASQIVCPSSPTLSAIGVTKEFAFATSPSNEGSPLGTGRSLLMMADTAVSHLTVGHSIVII
jgi:hypothetical protein